MGLPSDSAPADPRSLCCCWAGQNAAFNDPTRSFPRSPAEFAANGAAWATAVLRHEGRIGADNKVIAVEVSALGAAGLLSELCLLLERLCWGCCVHL